MRLLGFERFNGGKNGSRQEARRLVDKNAEIFCHNNSVFIHIVTYYFYIIHNPITTKILFPAAKSMLSLFSNMAERFLFDSMRVVIGFMFSWVKCPCHLWLGTPALGGINISINFTLSDVFILQKKRITHWMKSLRLNLETVLLETTIWRITKLRLILLYLQRLVMFVF